MVQKEFGKESARNLMPCPMVRGSAKVWLDHTSARTKEDQAVSDSSISGSVDRIRRVIAPEDEGRSA